MKKSIMILGTVLFLIAGWSLQAAAQEPVKKKEKTEVTSMHKMQKEGKTAKTCEKKEKKAEAKKACDEKKGDAMATAYQCPMKCEGDKTYDKPGKCPKCGMELKKVETKAAAEKKKQDQSR